MYENKISIHRLTLLFISKFNIIFPFLNQNTSDTNENGCTKATILQGLLAIDRRYLDFEIESRTVGLFDHSIYLIENTHIRWFSRLLLKKLEYNIQICTY